MPAIARYLVPTTGLLLALSGAGCQRDAPPDAASGSAPTASSTRAPHADASPPPLTVPAQASSASDDRRDAGRRSIYTGLSACRTLETQRDEGGYRLSECDGPAGFSVRLVEADGRHNLLVRRPGSDFTSLRLPEQRNGAFSEIAGRLEWRGSGDADAFAPDVLVLRYLAWEDPQAPTRGTSYLVPVALAATPCVAAFVAPGPQQSEQARRIADATPACLDATQRR
ncbi:hypothetical protein [Xanthomonas sp. XNM01]|uniref:hypothetical protein n=1 Tax=Xanthomonas sp. XNM01 TaxID=2769289 RepID=UPI0017837965|nr:hypothetical protein [Xanthomonas sp. XNM01]MBD9368511.1 hypothetical protein [Xanthomonas sp. XNM01]